VPARPARRRPAGQGPWRGGSARQLVGHAADADSQ